MVAPFLWLVLWATPATAGDKKLHSYVCYVDMKTYAVFAAAHAYSETHAMSIVKKRYRNGEVQWCNERR